MQDCISDNLPYDQCGSTTLIIVKAQSASNNIYYGNITTTLMTWQSFLVVLQGAMTIPDKCKGRTSVTPMQQSNIICCHSQDAMTAILRHGTTNSANTPSLGSAITLEKACMLPKASTASAPKTVCTMPRAHIVSTPSRPHLSRRVTMSPLPKREMTNCCQGWQLDWVQQWAPCHKGNWPRMLWKAMIASCHKGPCPLLQWVTGPQPLTIAKAPKRSQ